MTVPKRHSQAHRRRRCTCILLMVALLVPLLLVVPVMGAQAACAGTPLNSPSAGGSYAISVDSDGLWNYRFHLPPVNTVNWD